MLKYRIFLFKKEGFNHINLIFINNFGLNGNFLLKLMRNYHFGDVNIFWKDISENAKIRVENFYNLGKN